MEQSQTEFAQWQRAVWSRLVPEIAFVLLRCRAMRRGASIYEIADDALATYPEDFSTRYAGRPVPDYSIVLLALAEATKREWSYAAGDWYRWWRLTRKGLEFEGDVERRRAARKR